MVGHTNHSLAIWMPRDLKVCCTIGSFRRLLISFMILSCWSFKLSSLLTSEEFWVNSMTEQITWVSSNQSQVGKFTLPKCCRTQRGSSFFRPDGPGGGIQNGVGHICLIRWDPWIKMNVTDVLYLDPCNKPAFTTQKSNTHAGHGFWNVCFTCGPQWPI